MHYRFYGLGRNDRIVSADDVEASHDAEAVEKVMQKNKGDWELWCGTRKVARAPVTQNGAQSSGMMFG